MEILSYPVGLLIGLFPVIVDLGGRTEPAQLLLDGRPACTIPARGAADRDGRCNFTRRTASVFYPAPGRFLSGGSGSVPSGRPDRRPTRSPRGGPRRLAKGGGLARARRGAGRIRDRLRRRAGS